MKSMIWVLIAATFGCEPACIPQVLNRHNISQYTPSDNEQAKTITVGATIHWDELCHENALIVLNFDRENVVHYICDDGSFKLMLR